jgi:transposase-like protein
LFNDNWLITKGAAMKKKTTKGGSRSRRKSVKLEGSVDRIDEEHGVAQLSLPITEILAGIGDAVERVAGEAGLLIMKSLIDEEVEGLVGERYKHQEDRQAHRWGREETHVVFSGKKVAFDRPRVRGTGDGKELPLERLKLFQKNGRMQDAAARQVLLGVSMRDYEKAVDGVCDGYGIKKSSVSRNWKTISTKQLAELAERPLGDLDLVAIMIDGINFDEHVLAVSLGVSADGSKHVLGIRHGATENSQLCKELLADMIRRGLRDDQRYLFVLDGSKALHKAVTSVFGDNAVIQRCQVHKKRNVLSYLPKRYHFQIRSRIQMAWDMTGYPDAKKELEQVVEELKEINDSAARSLEEGLEETLTLHRLGIPPALRRSLRSTNLIENCFSSTKQKFCRNVKNWKNADMVLRWGGTMLRQAEKNFRRVKGYRTIPSLTVALRPRVDVSVKRA